MGSENTVTSPCYPFLAQTFGPSVFIWGIGLWVVKLIQVRMYSRRKVVGVGLIVVFRPLDWLLVTHFTFI